MTVRLKAQVMDIDGSDPASSAVDKGRSAARRTLAFFASLDVKHGHQVKWITESEYRATLPGGTVIRYWIESE